MSSITYRTAKPSDSARIVDFYNYVGGETSYLSFEKDEYPLSTEDLTAHISSLDGNLNNIMLLALDGDEIAGIATISSTHKIKGRHDGELGIVVAKKYQGQGIGSELIRQLIEWSRSNGVTTRLTLVTRTDNVSAVRLYLSFGFVTEGCCRHSVFLNGQYYDTYTMGLLL